MTYAVTFLILTNLCNSELFVPPKIPLDPSLDNLISIKQQDIACSRGTELASRYHSESCMRSKRNPRLIDRIKSMVDVAENPQRQANELKELTDLKYLSAKFLKPYHDNPPDYGTVKKGNNFFKRAIYIRNQKVASQLFFEKSNVYAGVGSEYQKYREFLLPYFWDTSNGHIRSRLKPWRSSDINFFNISHIEYRTINQYFLTNENDMFFTFVREPISCFIAGFFETMSKWMYVPAFRNPKYAHLVHPGDNKVDNKVVGKSLFMSKENGTKLFQTFLEDIEQTRYLGSESFHVWPQAVKIDSIPEGRYYSFIGNLSSFDISMKALFPNTKLPPNNHKAEDDEIKLQIMSTFTYGRSEIRRMCKILMSDFICFGYQVPTECQDLFE